MVEEGVVGHGGDEPGLGDDEERGHPADEHGEHHEAPRAFVRSAAAAGRTAPTGVIGAAGAPAVAFACAFTASFRQAPGRRYIGPRRGAPPTPRRRVGAVRCIRPGKRPWTANSIWNSRESCSLDVSLGQVPRCRRGSSSLQHGSGPPSLLASGGPDAPRCPSSQWASRCWESPGSSIARAAASWPSPTAAPTATAR